MTNTLLDTVRRYADANADRSGMALTPVAGLVTIRATAPSELIHAVSRPLVCLVLQGNKQVVMGADTYSFGAGDSLLITADVPITSQITTASPDKPYLSLVLELDTQVIADMAQRMQAEPVITGTPVQVEPTDVQVADTALRLMKLMDRPAAVLHGLLVDELHYWLLAGQHGTAIRRLGWQDGHAQRIGRAVAALRTNYTQPLWVERLADIAGMSPSSFHQHFRAVTSLSPLQFQKQLRLIEARRLMRTTGATASAAAFAVGYESVPQFTREYGRMFGLPPLRDTEAAREQLTAAA
jgi:transcriptional regulator GlxA family with amidase domain